MKRRLLAVTILFLLSTYLAAFSPNSIGAAPSEGFASTHIRAIWQRDDGSVASGRVSRPWMWGPGSFYTNYEPYREAQEGNHLVQYFDKGRLEINDPAGDPNSPWYVTSGLLVKEMVSGKAQTGDDSFYMVGPARIAVAGDTSDSSTPTYATFATLLARASNRDALPVTSEVDAQGRIREIQAREQVNYGPFEESSGHNWASVFWDFAHSPQRPAIFAWLPTLGYPITEPYWVRTTVKGAPQTVLVQLFERRSLTYNPANPPATQIEMGNVGRHYYNWRYANQHAADLNTKYNVKIEVGPRPTRAVHVEQTIDFTNTTGRTLENALLHVVWHHWDGVFTLSSVKVEDKETLTQWRQDINLEVTLPDPLAQRTSATITLSFDLIPRPVGGRTGYDRSNDILCLGDMLPTLVPWENGGWSYYPFSDLGDFGFYDTSDYTVEVASSGNEKLMVGGTGRITDVNTERTRWRFSAPNVRDAAYIVSPRFVDPLSNPSMTRQQGDIRLLAYFLPEHKADGQKQLDLTAPALGWFSSTIGSYPFGTYTIAEMGVPLERTDNYAQEYPMSYWLPTPWLQLGTTPGAWTWYIPVHEVGHQWFYSTIGNNQLTHPWLDEAMTSYITAEYVRTNFPEQYERVWNSTSARPAKAKPVSSGVFSGFTNEDEYSRSIYNNGVLMLQRAHQAMGNAAFYEALREYYRTFRFKRATPTDLLHVLQAHSNTDLKPIVADYFAY